MIQIGLFEKIFPKNSQQVSQSAVQGYFKMLNGYTPSFSTYNGSIFEYELCRSAIDRYASFCSKLKPEIKGNAYKNLEKTLQYKPNPFMTTPQFLYRLATILKVNNTAFILPLYAEDYETIVGFYPLLPQRTEIIEVGGEAWLKYHFANGQIAAIEFNRVGVLSRFNYKNDMGFGDSNDCLYPTINLLDTQRQGIIEGVKQSANIRFVARLGQIITPENLKKEKELFSTENLSSDNKTNVMMFDQKYADVKQVDSKPLWIDDKQQALIQNNVFNYFGTNEAIIQNKFTEEGFNSYYESEIECSFAIPLSITLSNMLFTQKELAFGNEVILSANRINFASNNTRVQMSTQLVDRGILSRNEAREMFNMSPIPDGDKYLIRLEYAEIGDLGNINDRKKGENNAIQDGEGIQTVTDPTGNTGE